MASAVEHRDGLIFVGDEAYTTAEWAALESQKARQAAYARRPEVKARKAAYLATYQARPEVKARQAVRMADIRRLAQLAREAGLG